jgi:hypothetical protein
MQVSSRSFLTGPLVSCSRTSLKACQAIFSIIAQAADAKSNAISPGGKRQTKRDIGLTWGTLYAFRKAKCAAEEDK